MSITDIKKPRHLKKPDLKRPILMCLVIENLDSQNPHGGLVKYCFISLLRGCGHIKQIYWFDTANTLQDNAILDFSISLVKRGTVVR